MRFEFKRAILYIDTFVSVAYLHVHTYINDGIEQYMYTYTIQHIYHMPKDY